MQVEHIRLTLGLKAPGFNQLKVHPSFKVLVSDVFNLHPYAEGMPPPPPAAAAVPPVKASTSVNLGKAEVQVEHTSG